MQIELGQLDEKNSAVDVTKLLVAYALRIGAVKENSWEELISVVIRRPSKRFVWETPGGPVFFGSTRGERLDFTKPAPIDQQNRFLRRAATLVGMMARPVAHDLRRGSAADINSLGAVENPERVRRQLGHTHQAQALGVTDKYVGRLKGDSWADRVVGSETAEDDPFGVQFAPTSFKKRKIATKDIDNYCTTKNLDKTNRNDRYKARQELEKAQFNQWMAGQQSIMDTPIPLSRTPTVESSSNESHDTALRRRPLNDITNLPQPQPAKTGQDDEVVESTVDEMMNALGFNNADHSNEVSVTTIDTMSLDFVSALACSPPLEQPILTSPTSAFISFLSTINLVSTATPRLPEDAEAGNSRLPPSKFFHACRKEGCLRSFDSQLHRDNHEVNCQGTLLDDLGDEESLPAGEDDLQVLPKARKRKAQNINVVHDGFPKPCPDSNICGVTKDFATQHLLNNHRRLHHDDSWPKQTPCNVPGCQLPRDHYFVSRESFRRHLSTYHHLTNTEAREYIGQIVEVTFSAPRGAGAAFMTTMCLFPDCTTTAEFANYSVYTSHLKKKHNQTPRQYPDYMPTAETVRLHPRPDIAKIDVSSPVPRVFEAGPCNHPLCFDIDTTYEDERALVRHLKVSHGVKKSDAARYFSGPEIAPFYGTICLHGDCSTKRRFYFDEKSYTEHLKRHGVTTVAEISSFQLWHKLKYGAVGVANEQT